MNVLIDYLNWLGAAEDGLVERSIPSSAAEIELLLQKILWHLTTSFFEGPFIKSEEPLRQPNSAIQYFSFPLYSHYKEISQDPPYWISRYPVFFGHREDSELTRVMTQYAFLYGGFLKQEKPDRPSFSLSSFAGDLKAGLSHPPRYIVFDLKCVNDNEETRATITPDNHVFLVDAYLPTPPETPPELLNLHQDVMRRFVTRPHPIIGRDFAATSAASFWDFFDEIVEECADLAAAIKLIERFADTVESIIGGEAAKKIALREQNRIETTAKGLAHFVAWNYALGFRKIVYCPFRIAEPFSAGLVSWGGGILVLSNSVSLTTVLQGLSRDKLGPSIRSRKVAELLSQLLAAVRFFIDVATPKVVLGDWRCYQQEVETSTIHKNQAQGISEALGHELKGLHTLVETYLKEDELDQVFPFLETSQRIAEVVYEAYTKKDAFVHLDKFMERLLYTLQLSDLQIIDNGMTQRNPKVLVPFPILYVVAELCRNAYKNLPRKKLGDPKEIVLNFVTHENKLLEVHVMNQTENPQSMVSCKTRHPKSSSDVFGLDQVMKLVCDLLHGEFSLQIAEGRAIASVKLADTHHHESR